MRSNKVVRWVVVGCLFGVWGLPAPESQAEVQLVEWRSSGDHESWLDPLNWWNCYPPGGVPSPWPDPTGDQEYDVAIFNGAVVTLDDPYGSGGGRCYGLSVGAVRDGSCISDPGSQKKSGALYLNDFLNVFEASVGFAGTGTLEFGPTGQYLAGWDGWIGNFFLGDSSGHGRCVATSECTLPPGNSRMVYGKLQIGSNGTGIFEHASGRVFPDWVGIGFSEPGDPSLPQAGWGMYALGKLADATSHASSRLTAFVKVNINGGLIQNAGTVETYGNGEFYGVGVGNLMHGTYMHCGGICLVSHDGLQVGYTDQEKYSWSGGYYTAITPGAGGVRGYYTIMYGASAQSTGYGDELIPRRPGVGIGMCNADYSPVYWLNSAAGATGFLYLGRDEWTGWLLGADGMMLRRTPWISGILRGWSQTRAAPTLPVPNGGGPITLAEPIPSPTSETNQLRVKGLLINNGRMVADGYGSDNHLLNLSYFGSELSMPQRLSANPVTKSSGVGNLYEAEGNPLTDNGWFAQNHGLLALPPVYLYETEVIGQDPVTRLPIYDTPWLRSLLVWGDADGSSSIDLVNSLCMDPVTMTGANQGAALYGALVAPDRVEVAEERPLLANGWIPLGIWHLRCAYPDAGGYATLSLPLEELTIRYDHTQIPPAAEQKLRVLKWDPTTPGHWDDLEPGFTVTHSTEPHVHTLEADFTTGSFQIDDTYLTVVSPGWVWNGGNGTWTGTGNWRKPTGLTLGDSPNGGAYSACIDEGGEVDLNGASGSAAMLIVGCSDNRQTPNQVTIEAGDTLTVHSLRLGAVDENSDGSVLQTGGTLSIGHRAETVPAPAWEEMGDLLVGENGTGAVTQTGGNCSVGRIMHIGLYPTATGTYDISGGTLNARAICVGTEGAGTLKVTGNRISGVQDLTIRANLYATGRLQATGDTLIASEGDEAVLTMNGEVRANGGTLDLSTFKTVQNNIDNEPPYSGGLPPADGTVEPFDDKIAPYGPNYNGWYAENGGSIKLPPVAIYTDQSTYTWGETEYTLRNAGIDLANSMQVTFASVPAIGEMRVELLATDRPETNLLDSPLILGVWHMTLTNFSSGGRFKFRYDDHDVPAEAEDELVVYYGHVDAGVITGWTELTTSSVNVPTHVAEATLSESVSDAYFAVGLPAGRWDWGLSGAGNWTVNANWTETGLDSTKYPFPNSLGYQAYVGNDGSYVGNSGTVLVNASSSGVMAARALHLGSSPGYSATLDVADNKSVALRSLLVGEASAATGTCTLHGGTINGLRKVEVRCQESAAGTFQGWGTIGTDGTATFTNNGIVRALGNNSEVNVLDLGGFATIDNTLPNTGTNGWYAPAYDEEDPYSGKGKLTLPAITIEAESGPTYTKKYHWGEKEYSTANATIDLVNSMQIAPNSAVVGGDLQISLLARDRHEDALNALMWPTYPEGEPNGYHPLAIWEISSASTFPFTSANVTVRYDHMSGSITGFSACGQSEDTLILAMGIKNGSTWSWGVVSRGVDVTHHQLMATGVTFPGSTDPVYLAVMQQYPGDMNLDGYVDVVDLLSFVCTFGTSVEDPTECDFEYPCECHEYHPAADFNGDDLVDVADLVDLSNNFGFVPGDGCQTSQGESSMMMSQSLDAVNDAPPAWYEALEQVGLLDEYLGYIAEHPEAARTR